MARRSNSGRADCLMMVGHELVYMPGGYFFDGAGHGMRARFEAFEAQADTKREEYSTSSRPYLLPDKGFRFNVRRSPETIGYPGEELSDRHFDTYWKFGNFYHPALKRYFRHEF